MPEVAAEEDGEHNEEHGRDGDPLAERAGLPLLRWVLSGVHGLCDVLLGAAVARD